MSRVFYPTRNVFQFQLFLMTTLAFLLQYFQLLLRWETSYKAPQAAASLPVFYQDKLPFECRCPTTVNIALCLSDSTSSARIPGKLNQLEKYRFLMVYQCEAR